MFYMNHAATALKIGAGGGSLFGSLVGTVSGAADCATPVDVPRTFKDEIVTLGGAIYGCVLGMAAGAVVGAITTITYPGLISYAIYNCRVDLFPDQFYDLEKLKEIESNLCVKDEI